MQLYHKKKEKSVQDKSYKNYQSITDNYISQEQIDSAIQDCIDVLPFWRPVNNDDIHKYSEHLYKIAFYTGYMRHASIVSDDLDFNIEPYEAPRDIEYDEYLKQHPEEEATGDIIIAYDPNDE